MEPDERERGVFYLLIALLLFALLCVAGLAVFPAGAQEPEALRASYAYDDGAWRLRLSGADYAVVAGVPVKHGQSPPRLDLTVTAWRLADDDQSVALPLPARAPFMTWLPVLGRAY
jgi:hypothetical protein